MEDQDTLKMAILSGASHALKYKSKNFRKSDEEVIQYISDILPEIIDKLDKEE